MHEMYHSLVGIIFATYYVFVTLFLLQLLMSNYPIQHLLVFDVVVYDATAGGITAAVSASRKGLKTVIVCASWPSCFTEGGKRVGGMSSNGLGKTDIGDTDPYISGIAREFYTRNRNVYNQKSNLGNL